MATNDVTSRRRITLLGIGHTHAEVVRRWIDHPFPNCDLVCISQYPIASYSGMLPGAIGGQFEDPDWQIDLRRLCNRAGAKLIIDETIACDRRSRRIYFQRHAPLDYDLLSIGIGSVPAGIDDIGNCPDVIGIRPMQTFQIRLRHHPKLAHPEPRIAVVGGGLAGAEIAMGLRRMRSRVASSPGGSITLYTSSSRVGDELNSRAGVKLRSILTDSLIEVVDGGRVTNIVDGQLSLADGRRYRADVVIWATGGVAPPLLSRFVLPTDDRGFPWTTPTLQSIADAKIFVVGDSGTLKDHHAPKAGVYAVRQAPVLWHNLRASLDGGAMKSFQPQRDFLKLLNTGDGKALLQYGPLVCHAKWCWWLKRHLDQRFIQRLQI